MSLQKFHVLTTRPVIYSTVITVEAESDEEAYSLAEDIVATVPKDAWQVQSAQGDYRAHHFLALPNEVFKEEGNEAAAFFEHMRYYILGANCYGGDGEPVAQPWFEKLPKDMQVDVAYDWARALMQRAMRGMTMDEFNAHNARTKARREDLVIEHLAQLEAKYGGEAGAAIAE